nr:MAG TPA: hypothetical protein [Caudoviricetes sp.]
MLVCTRIWIWTSIGDFWWVGLSYFLSEGESLRILHPFRGIIASLNT